MARFDFLERGQAIVPTPHLLYEFSRKMFLMLYSINWLNVAVPLPSFLEIFDKYISITCLPGCDVSIFEINLILLVKPFFYMTKNLNILRTKRGFKTWNKKYFSSFLKGFQLPKIVLDLIVRLSVRVNYMNCRHVRLCW